MVMHLANVPSLILYITKRILTLNWRWVFEQYAL